MRVFLMTVFTLTAGAVNDRSDTVPAWPQPLFLPDQGTVEDRPQPPGGGTTYKEQTFTAPMARDRMCAPGRFAPTGVSAVLTDEILRGLGQDPYRMPKARSQAATLDERMRMAVQTQQDDVQTSLDQLPESLAGFGLLRSRDTGKTFSPHGAGGR